MGVSSWEGDSGSISSGSQFEGYSMILQTISSKLVYARDCLPLRTTSYVLNLTPEHQRVAEVLFRGDILCVIELAPIDPSVLDRLHRPCHGRV